MAKQPKSRLDPTTPAAATSLADLLRQRGVAVGQAPAAASASVVEPATTGALDVSQCRKLVVCRERKGHGGKTVTVIDGLELAPARLETLARALRIALGCGSRVDGGRVVVQGDLAAAVEAWLRRHGARRVVVGN